MKIMCVIALVLFVSAMPCLSQEQSESLDPNPCRVWPSIPESEGTTVPTPIFCQITDDGDPFGAPAPVITSPRQPLTSPSRAVTETLVRWWKSFTAVVGSIDWRHALK